MSYCCWPIPVPVHRFNHHFFKYLPVVLNSSSSLIEPHSNPNKYYTWMPDITVYSIQFSWFAQSCPTLCNPMDYSMPGFPVHHQLTELAQIHVHRVSDAIQPSHPLSSPSPSAFSLSQHRGLFQWVSSSNQVAKVLEFQLQHQSFQWISRTVFL